MEMLFDGTVLGRLDRWETVSLFVAFLVLVVALYRWLLMKWRSNVDLIAYAYLHPPRLDSETGRFKVRVEIPKREDIRLDLLDADERDLKSILEGPQEIGEKDLTLDMSNYPEGKYFIRMITPDQKLLKRFDLKK